MAVYCDKNALFKTCYLRRRHINFCDSTKYEKKGHFRKINKETVQILMELMLILRNFHFLRILIQFELIELFTAIVFSSLGDVNRRIDHDRGILLLLLRFHLRVSRPIGGARWMHARISSHNADEISIAMHRCCCWKNWVNSCANNASALRLPSLCLATSSLSSLFIFFTSFSTPRSHLPALWGLHDDSIASRLRIRAWPRSRVFIYWKELEFSVRNDCGFSENQQVITDS